jgi:nitroreductase
MEFTELIHMRESVRSYDPDKPVPKEILEKILDAGRLAPSACNIQPYKFLIISSSALLGKVKGCYKRDWFGDAPHILVMVGLKDKAWTRSYDGYNSIETDVAIAMTHIILAAENEGVGACWIAAYDPGILNDIIKPGKDDVIYGITPIGYTRAKYKKSSLKKRKSLEELVEYL